MTNPDESNSCEECHGKFHGAGSEEDNIQDIQAEIGTPPEYTPVVFTTGTSLYPQVTHVVPIPVKQETDGIDDVDLRPARKNRQRIVAGIMALVFFILPMLASAVFMVHLLIESVRTEQVEHQDSQ